MVFDQAENRLHAQKALLSVVFALTVAPGSASAVSAVVLDFDGVIADTDDSTSAPFKTCSPAGVGRSVKPTISTATWVSTIAAWSWRSIGTADSI